MNLLSSLALFLSLLVFESLTRFVPIHLKHDDPKVQEDNVKRFLSKKRLLNRLQAEVFGIKVTTDDSYDNRDDDENFAIGDVLYSEAQLDELIESVQGRVNRKRARGGRVKRSFDSRPGGIWPMPIRVWADTASGVDYPAVLAGLNFWMNETCIEFHSGTENNHDIYFVKEGGTCSSFIGKLMDPQPIYLPDRCYILGIVTHEIAHALGAEHEHTRADRDAFVSINTANIPGSMEHNWDILSYPEMNGYGVGYDYQSIMHYSGYTFLMNEWNQVIQTKNPDYQKTIGQIEKPSFADVKRMNRLYCGGVCESHPKIACRNNGYPDPKNCSVCKCPPPFTGPLCGGIETGDATCFPKAVSASSNMQTISGTGAGSCYNVITGPAGTQIWFNVTKLEVTSSPEFFEICVDHYLDINYNLDFTYGGARFCDGTKPVTSRSQSNKLALIYKGHVGAQYEIQFRAV